jgi:hypothetical protein
MHVILKSSLPLEKQINPTNISVRQISILLTDTVHEPTVQMDVFGLHNACSRRFATARRAQLDIKGRTG